MGGDAVTGRAADAVTIVMVTDGVAALGRGEEVVAFGVKGDVAVWDSALGRDVGGAADESAGAPGLVA
jgi:hypothetical protein